MPLALVDPDFAKEQLTLLLREWYMHPNGQLPAYEWAFGDVNPPVHAWAVWRVYKIEKKRRGVGDRVFLARVLPQAAAQLHVVGEPQGRRRQQRLRGRIPRPGQHRCVRSQRARCRPADTSSSLTATSWMAMYSLNLLAIAMELAAEDPAYEDVASKFWEHFLYIAHAMTNLGSDGIELWDDEDGFFYDVLHLPDGTRHPLKVRSMVGLIPLFAVETLEPDDAREAARLLAAAGVVRRESSGPHGERRLHADAGSRRAAAARRRATPTRLERVLRVMLDEREFLSPYGIRALSRAPSRRAVPLHRGRHRASRGLRAGRVDDRAVRRQLELARADLVSGQLPAHRVAAEVPPLPRRRSSRWSSRRDRASA